MHWPTRPHRRRRFRSKSSARLPKPTRGRSSTAVATRRCKWTCDSRPARLHRAAMPSGTSTGTREALELWDGDASFGSRSVTRADRHVNREIAEAVRGLDAGDQRGVDEAMIALDGTGDKSRLGASAVRGVCRWRSPAPPPTTRNSRCGAFSAARTRICSPVPCMNVLNGGAHADNPSTSRSS